MPHQIRKRKPPQPDNLPTLLPSNNCLLKTKTNAYIVSKCANQHTLLAFVKPHCTLTGYGR